MNSGDIVWTTIDARDSGLATAAVCQQSDTGKALIVYYYPDAETAYNDDTEIRDRYRSAFSQNGAFNFDLDCVNNFSGTREELMNIEKKLRRRETEDDISCSVFAMRNISQILKEWPRDFEFIVINGDEDSFI